MFDAAFCKNFSWTAYYVYEGISPRAFAGHKIPFSHHVYELPSSGYVKLRGNKSLHGPCYAPFRATQDLRGAVSTSWTGFRPPHAEVSLGTLRLEGVRLAGKSFVLLSEQLFFNPLEKHMLAMLHFSSLECAEANGKRPSACLSPLLCSVLTLVYTPKTMNQLAKLSTLGPLLPSLEANFVPLQNVVPWLKAICFRRRVTNRLRNHVAIQRASRTVTPPLQ